MTPEALYFADDGAFPNSRLPLLIHRAALPADPARMAETFAAHRWLGAWRGTIYPYHHFHGTTHEVLGIARGMVRVALGGPHGSVAELRAGDVVVIPAGVGHRNLGDEDLVVVGAYPDGAAWDLRRGDPAEIDAARQAVARVPPPAADPLGTEWLVRLWSLTPPRPARPCG